MAAVAMREGVVQVAGCGDAIVRRALLRLRSTMDEFDICAYGSCAESLPICVLREL